MTFERVKLGRVARTISGTGFPPTAQGNSAGEVPFLKVSDLALEANRAGVEYANNWISSSALKGLGGRVAPAGSIVFPKVGAALLGNARAQLLRAAAMDNNLMAVVPTAGDSRFWLYALSSIDLAKFSPGGPLPYVTDSQVRDLQLFMPPLDEQRRIADFLDTETARLDQLANLRIRQASTLVEAGLSQAFAGICGRDEPGARRPTGVDWLGDVPASWPVMAVSHQFDVQLGKMLNPERAAGQNLAPYLRNTDVQWDRINTNDLLYMDFPPSERARYGLREGDLMICEGGEPGRAAIWDGSVVPLYYQKALHRARPRSFSLARWLFYCLRAATSMNVFAVEGNTTTIAHLTGEQLRAHRFPFPPPETQARIVGRLDASAEQRGAVLVSMQRQIEVLSERRQTLITAAVTGELDVTTARGASA